MGPKGGWADRSPKIRERLPPFRYPRLLEFHHFDIRRSPQGSEGQRSHGEGGGCALGVAGSGAGLAEAGIGEDVALDILL